MAKRIMLVIALAIVVGFGVSQIIAQGRNTAVVAETGETLDAALGGSPDRTNAERWYDNPTPIGLMAGGAVLVVGLVLVALAQPNRLDANEGQP